MDYIAAKCAAARGVLSSACIFITGANGFVGSWLEDSARWMGFRVAGHRGRRAGFGDIRDAVIPPSTTHIVHCANATTGAENVAHTDRVCEAIQDGTKRVVREADRLGAKLLLVSSGSVYDASAPREGWAIPDDAPTITGHDGSVASRIAWAKLQAERYALAFRPRGGVVIARGFAFYGPRMPEHLLIGAMMAEASGKVGGDHVFTVKQGDAVRSYCYASDVTRFLWALLARGVDGEAYNVGSEHPMRLAQLAVDFANLGTRTSFGANTGYDHAQGAPFYPSLRKLRNLVGEMWCDQQPVSAHLAKWYRWEGGQ